MSQDKNTRELYNLSKRLTNQSWDSIGSINGLTNSKNSMEELEKQLLSLLVLRLDILHASRKYPLYSISRLKTELTNGNIPSGTLKENPKVFEELKSYVSSIQNRYNDVPYHSYYHCAQVTISMNKLISMIVEEEESAASTTTTYAKSALRRCSYNDVNLNAAKDQYTVTNGIGNNPAIHFALLFSALIHDAGHMGVSNMQLSKESNDLAIVYNDQSIAEQNSISTSFLMLYSDNYKHLISFIAPTVKERQTFRRLVIEIVMCTDIASPDRTQLAKSKWKEAFEIQRTDILTSLPKPTQPFRSASTIIRGTSSTRPIRFGIRRALNLSGDNIDFYTDSAVSLKRSTILEQMMAVADISHIYQDFDTLLIWNEKLFHELIVAHSQNRGFDPCGFWFKGQIGFIDNYVIPLADRLSLCDVFGENSFLFLKNAKEIRRRWIEEGFQFCEELLDKYSDLLE